MEKQFNVRFTLKHDTEENWAKAKNFIPKESEPIIYDEDATHSYKRYKIGDGITKVNALPFVMDPLIKAVIEEEIADWARAETKPSYTATEVGAISYTDAQELTEEQKAQARENIGAGTGSGEGVSSYNDLTNKPIENGSGEGSIEFGDGEAIGAHSLAGGTSEKALFENLIGETLANQIDIENSKAKGDMSISLGANNESNAPGSLTLGVSNKTGINGYFWNTINFTGDNADYSGCPTITLSAKRPYCSVEFKVAWPPYEIISHDEEVSPEGGWSTLDWQVGDSICIMNKGNMYAMCSTILAISGNKITVNSLPFKKNDYTSFVEGYADVNMPYPYEAEYIFPHDRTIFAIKVDTSTDNTAESRYILRSGVTAASLGFGARAIGAKAVSTGILASAEGFNTLAANNFDHAEGNGVRATGGCSHGEGKETVSGGYAAHSEGQETQALAPAAHAEGMRSIANRPYAHAEGFETRAGQVDGSIDQWAGSYAHAEGERTQALHYAAHAEGQETRAQALASHAEGIGTIATVPAQHVQGKYNITDDTSAFIIGNGSDDSNRRNIFSISWQGAGYFADNINAKKGIFSDDLSTTGKISAKNGVFSGDISGVNANFSGTVKVNNQKLLTETDVNSILDSTTKFISSTTASNMITNAFKANYITAGSGGGLTGEAATAEGKATTSTGEASHAEGLFSKATQQGAHAEGTRAWYNDTEGYRGTSAEAIGAHGEGIGTKANAMAAHSEGQFTEAGYNAIYSPYKDSYIGAGAHAEGYKTIAAHYYTHAEGKETVANGESAHAGGESSRASGKASFVHGTGLIAEAENQAVFGKYNAINNNALFIVGNGTADSDAGRSNAFEVISTAEGVAIKVGNTILTESFLQSLINLKNAEGGAY